MALLDPVIERELVPRVSLVIARSRNGVIGAHGSLPWRIPQDLRHFRRVTDSKTIVMGRATYDSIGRALPNRSNIVMTRNRNWAAPHVKVAHDWDHLAELTADLDEVFIIGGAELFRSVGRNVEEVILTEIDADYDGDTFLPAFEPGEWEEVSREDHPAGANTPPFSFRRLTRR